MSERTESTTVTRIIEYGKGRAKTVHLTWKDDSFASLYIEVNNPYSYGMTIRSREIQEFYDTMKDVLENLRVNGVVDE